MSKNPLLVLGLACVAGLILVPQGAYAKKRHDLVYSRRVREMTRDHLPNLQSPVAYVVEWPSGKVLLERDADSVRPVASLSKLMGALVIAEECNLPPAQLQEVSKGARQAAALQGGNRFSKLRVGWSYSVLDLLHATMLKSDNKALPTLAEACGMDAAGLGVRMTARAKKMGLQHTAFVEPDGLSEQNISNAREMAQILKEVLANPGLRQIMGKTTYTLTAHKGKRTELVPIRNTDQLVTRDVLDTIGGKTGFTNLARYCLAAAARLPGTAGGAAGAGGSSVGMVFLGAEGRDTRFGDFMRMYKWLTAPELAEAREAHTDTIVMAPVATSTTSVAAVATAVPGSVAAAAGMAPTATASASASASARPGDASTAPASGGEAPAGGASGALPTSGFIARLYGVISKTLGG